MLQRYSVCLGQRYSVLFKYRCSYHVLQRYSVLSYSVLLYSVLSTHMSHHVPTTCCRDIVFCLGQRYSVLFRIACVVFSELLLFYLVCLVSITIIEFSELLVIYLVCLVLRLLFLV